MQTQLRLRVEVFAGNRTDVTTVEEIVKSMEEKYGQAERVWVMDRGMVSEKNIAFLRARNARYLVGTPKSQLREFEKEMLDAEGWSEVQSGLEARLIAHPDGKGEEQYVLCRSTARAEKERAMLARQSDHLCAELLKIDTALRRKPEHNVEKLGRRIGHWQRKNPAAKLIVVEVGRDDSGAAAALSITTPLDNGRRTEQHHGSHPFGAAYGWLSRSAQLHRARPRAVASLRSPFGQPAAGYLRCAPVLAPVYPIDPGRSRLSHRQERPQTASHLPPEDRACGSPHR